MASLRTINELPECTSPIEGEMILPIVEIINTLYKPTMKISINSIVDFVEKKLLENGKVEFLRSGDVFILIKG